MARLPRAESRTPLGRQRSRPTPGKRTQGSSAEGSSVQGGSRASGSRTLVAIAFVVLFGCGCATMGLRSAVSMKVHVADAPSSALVYIDGQYIGKLGYVAKHGVRLVEGKHRISVEKNGYYPYDVIVVSDRKTIELRVEMLRLPD